jgi:hypothetical protein
MVLTQSGGQFTGLMSQKLQVHAEQLCEHYDREQYSRARASYFANKPTHSMIPKSEHNYDKPAIASHLCARLFFPTFESRALIHTFRKLPRRAAVL